LCGIEIGLVAWWELSSGDISFGGLKRKVLRTFEDMSLRFLWGTLARSV